MPILRILAGVIVGAGILAGLLAAAMRFPAAAMVLVFGAAGTAFSGVSVHGLRTGSIGARRSRYPRNRNPLAFWFYVFFYAFIGALLLGYCVSIVLFPEVAARR